MSHHISAAAASAALLIHTMQTDKAHTAKRQLFEDAAYAHYKERTADADMDQATFVARNPEQPDFYYFSDLNTAWWGFQAGFMAAAVLGDKA